VSVPVARPEWLSGSDPSHLLAHGEEGLAPFSPSRLWSAWENSPLVVLLLVIPVVAYALGVRRLHRRGVT